MARQRIVKPELFDSESLGSCSIAARFAFIGLLIQADDYGRMKWQPNRLKTRILPYDKMTPAKFAALVDELEKVGCVEFYEVDGERYLNVPNFLVYQTIQRPSKSNIPEPPKAKSKNAHGTLNEHSMSTHTKEIKKEGRKGNSKEFSLPKEECATVGAEASKAAPPVCPKCGNEMSITGTKVGKKRLFMCWDCDEETWICDEEAWI